MTKIRRSLLCLVAALVLVCAATEVTLAQRDGPDKDLSVVTYNTGLAPFNQALLDTYDIRLAAILQSLRTDEVFTTSDILCLQGLRLQEDLLAAQASLRTAGLPYHYSFYDDLLPRFSSSQPACSNMTAVNAAFACGNAIPQCQAAASFGGNFLFFFQCVVSFCPAEFARLSPTCLPCLFDWRHLPQFMFDQQTSLQRCMVSRQTDYIPTYGLSLSSRLPLSNVRYRAVLNGTTQTVVRGYIHATHPTLGEVSCTLQTSEDLRLTGFPAPDGFLTYSDIVQNETANIIAEFAGQRGIAMGDLNTSPSLPANGVVGTALSVYQRYLDAGFRSALILANNASCSFCRANPLNTSLADLLIDHIFVSSHLRDSVIAADLPLQDNIPGRAFPLSGHWVLRAIINTGGEYSVALSRWVRQFGAWNTAFEQWQQQRDGSCPAT